jgi:hypothetical protein
MSQFNEFYREFINLSEDDVVKVIEDAQETTFDPDFVVEVLRLLKSEELKLKVLKICYNPNFNFKDTLEMSAQFLYDESRVSALKIMKPSQPYTKEQVNEIMKFIIFQDKACELADYMVEHGYVEFPIDKSIFDKLLPRGLSDIKPRGPSYFDVIMERNRK